MTDWRQSKPDIYENFSNIKNGDVLKASMFQAFKKHCSYVEYTGRDESGKEKYIVVYQKRGIEIKVVA